MDESTSALDTENEALLYQALASAGITYVSVGHRPSLVEFHSNVLRLSPPADGSAALPSWVLAPTASAQDPEEVLRVDCASANF